MCGAFRDFYASMSSAPPEGRQIELVRLAQRVEGAAIARAQHISRRVFNDANDLVAYVGASDFPTQGNLAGAPIQRMVDDCF